MSASPYALALHSIWELFASPCFFFKAVKVLFTSEFMFALVLPLFWATREEVISWASTLFNPT
jgi:hypothetical protein